MFAGIDEIRVPFLNLGNVWFASDDPRCQLIKGATLGSFVFGAMTLYAHVMSPIWSFRSTLSEYAEGLP